MTDFEICVADTLKKRAGHVKMTQIFGNRGTEMDVDGSGVGGSFTPPAICGHADVPGHVSMR